ncbi:MAG: hypothetical protein FWF46_06710 [Oscillospiraceae bacterium]|nr:hypothetical protein [Oscillospiraceae bacterium]
MNYEDIKKIIEDMEKYHLNELNIEFPDGTKVSMKKNENKVLIKNNNAGGDVGFRSQRK